MLTPRPIVEKCICPTPPQPLIFKILLSRKSSVPLTMCSLPMTCRLQCKFVSHFLRWSVSQTLPDSHRHGYPMGTNTCIDFFSVLSLILNVLSCPSVVCSVSVHFQTLPRLGRQCHDSPGFSYAGQTVVDRQPSIGLVGRDGHHTEYYHHSTRPPGWPRTRYSK